MEQILLYIAIPVSVFYVLQIIVTFMGMDAFDGVEADFDGDMDSSDSSVMQLFTLRNAVSFLVGLSWGTLICIREWSLNEGVSLLIGISIGLVMVIINISLFFVMKKLEKKQIPSLDSTIGQECTVYLKIPSGGIGKVTVIVNGSYRVLDATSPKGDILTGERATVVKIVGETLVVEKI